MSVFIITVTRNKASGLSVLGSGYYYKRVLLCCGGFISDCVSAGAAKTTAAAPPPAAETPPPPAPPAAAAAPVGGPIPTSMPPVPPVPAQPIQSKPGQEKSHHRWCWTFSRAWDVCSVILTCVCVVVSAIKPTAAPAAAAADAGAKAARSEHRVRLVTPAVCIDTLCRSHAERAAYYFTTYITHHRLRKHWLECTIQLLALLTLKQALLLFF